MRILGQGVSHFSLERSHLLNHRDNLPSDGAIWIVRIHQIREIGRNIDPETVRGRKPCCLLGDEVDHLGKVVCRIQAVG